MKKRKANYDVLRILSTIAVILIHVCASYITLFGFKNRSYVFITYIFDSLARFAVPCFLMLSGAFLLDEERNKDYKYFYRKAFQTIGIPTILFSFFYFLYSLLKYGVKIYFFAAPLNGLIEPVKNLIKGWPFYHMWYLYMLLGVYALVPFLIKLKNDIGEKKFAIVSYVFLILASVSEFTSTHTFYWDIGSAFCYASYLMVGYTLRKKVSSSCFKYRQLLGILEIVLGKLLLFVLAFFKMLQKYKGVFLQYKVFSPFCPIIVIASLLIFSGFSSLKIKHDFSKLSKYTFMIFLIHAGIWDVCTLFMKKTFVIPSFIFIPVCTFWVFFSSLFFVFLYQRIKKRNKILSFNEKKLMK